MGIAELPHNRHNEWEELQDDLYHLADSVSFQRYF